MTDLFTRKKRSEIMSRIGGKDTAPELRVRRLLHALGFRFRLHRTDLPGKPDIVLPRHNKVILVHGCFWHSHEGCPRAALPATNTEFWRTKIEKNVTRDKRVCSELCDLDWSVLIVWQCELKTINVLRARVLNFLSPMCGNRLSPG